MVRRLNLLKNTTNLYLYLSTEDFFKEKFGKTHEEALENPFVKKIHDRFQSKLKTYEKLLPFKPDLKRSEPAYEEINELSSRIEEVSLEGGKGSSWQDRRTQENNEPHQGR